MNSRDKVITFVIGAGFSHAIANLPLTVKLTIKILELVENSKDRFVNKDFYLWLVSNLKNKNFEQVSELLLHLNQINNSNPTFIIDSKNIGKDTDFAYAIIKASLYDNLSDFEIKKSLVDKFKFLIEHYINQGYVINVFDLNFDSVFEEIFFAENYYNDFFENCREIFYDSQKFLVGKFNPNLKAQLNHFKLHGALNIFRMDFYVYDDIIRNNFYKLYSFKTIKNIFIDQILSRTDFHGFKEERFNGTKEYLPFSNHLIIGNLMKELNQARVDIFSTHSRDHFHDSINNSQAIVFIGFSNNDADITNTFLMQYMKSDSKSANFLVHKNTKVHGIRYLSCPLNELDTMNDDPDFETWMTKIYSSKFEKQVQV